MAGAWDIVQRWAAAWLPFWIDVALKAAGVLLLASGLAAVLRGRSAATRRFLWVLALAAVVALPAASLVLPAWRVLPAWAAVGAPPPTRPAPAPTTRDGLPAAAPGASGLPSRNGAPSLFAPRPNMALAEGPAFDEARRSGAADSRDAAAPRSAVEAAAPGHSHMDLPDAEEAWLAEEQAWWGRSGSGASPSTAPTSSTATTAQPEPAVSPWAVAALLVWAAGAGLCLVPLVLGRLGLWRLGRRCHPVEPGSWTDLARRAARTVGLRGRVVLLWGRPGAMPMVWGLLRPRLLLPADGETWSPRRRWAVLVHDLAHVRRHDCLGRLLSRLACALHWFNPLCWRAAGRLRAEAEAACDDAVLAAGSRPSDYARHLLEVACAGRCPAGGWAAIAMARPSGLETRVRGILDARRNRRGPRRAHAVATAVVIAALVLPMAVLRAGGAPASDVLERDPRAAGADGRRVAAPGAPVVQADDQPAAPPAADDPAAPDAAALDPAEVDRLVDQLSADTWRRRDQADRRLREMMPQVLPLLQKHLGHPDPEVRLRVQSMFDDGGWVTEGAIVLQVDPGSAADRAGLRCGDVITAAGETAVVGPSDLTIEQGRWGALAPARACSIVRDGTKHRVDLPPQLYPGQAGYAVGAWTRGPGWLPYGQALRALEEGDGAAALAHLRKAAGAGLRDPAALRLLIALAGYHDAKLARTLCRQYEQAWRAELPPADTQLLSSGQALARDQILAGGLWSAVLAASTTPQGAGREEDMLPALRIGREFNWPLAVRLAARWRPRGEDGPEPAGLRALTLAQDALFARKWDRAVARCREAPARPGLGYYEMVALVSVGKVDEACALAERALRAAAGATDPGAGGRADEAFAPGGGARPRHRPLRGGGGARPRHRPLRAAAGTRDPGAGGRADGAAAPGVGAPQRYLPLPAVYYALSAACATGRDDLRDRLVARMKRIDIHKTWGEPYKFAHYAGTLTTYTAPSVLEALLAADPDRSGDSYQLGYRALKYLTFKPDLTAEEWDKAWKRYGEPAPEGDKWYIWIRSQGLMRIGKYAEAKAFVNKFQWRAWRKPVVDAIDFCTAHAEKLAGPWKRLQPIYEVYPARQAGSTWVCRRDGRTFLLDATGRIHEYPGLAEGMYHRVMPGDYIEASEQGTMYRRRGQVYVLDEEAGRWVPTYVSMPQAIVLTGRWQPDPTYPTMLHYLAKHYPADGPGREMWRQEEVGPYMLYQFRGGVALAVRRQGHAVVDLTGEIAAQAGAGPRLKLYRVSTLAGADDPTFVCPTDRGMWVRPPGGPPARVPLPLANPDVPVVRLPWPYSTRHLYVGVPPAHGGQVFVCDLKTMQVRKTGGFCGLGASDSTRRFLHPVRPVHCDYALRRLRRAYLAQQGRQP